MVGVRVKTPTGNTFYYPFTDHLGNVVAMSWRGAGVVPNSHARYDPFGNFRTTPTATNPSLTSRGFTGHAHNNTGVYPTQNVGLIYMNARYYLPEIGRFISADTIVPNPANPQSHNRYSYGYNNPVKYSDPSGHTPWDLLDILSFALSVKDFAEEPSWTNAGWLALDTVCLAPLIPSVGSVRHGAKLINRLDDVGDATRIVGHLDDGAKALNYANRLKDIGSASSEGAKVVDELVAMGTHGSLEPGAVVSLGHSRAFDGGISGYVDWAEAHTATYLSLPNDVGKSLEESGNWWAVNQKFIDDAMSAKASFHLQQENARWPGWFAQEIEYILKGDYKRFFDGTDYWLVPK
jgi:RHS repeat-associated protein